MRKFSCYQWLVRDNQELNYPQFIITPRHYVSREDVDKDFAPENTECCFHPIKPIRESELTGELAEMIYDMEQERRKHRREG